MSFFRVIQFNDNCFSSMRTILLLATHYFVTHRSTSISHALLPNKVPSKSISIIVFDCLSLKNTPDYHHTTVEW